MARGRGDAGEREARDEHGECEAAYRSRRHGGLRQAYRLRGRHRRHWTHAGPPRHNWAAPAGTIPMAATKERSADTDAGRALGPRIRSSAPPQPARSEWRQTLALDFAEASASAIAPSARSGPSPPRHGDVFRAHAQGAGKMLLLMSESSSARWPVSVEHGDRFAPRRSRTAASRSERHRREAVVLGQKTTDVHKSFTLAAARKRVGRRLHGCRLGCCIHNG